MTIEIRRGIVIGLGWQGYQIAVELGKRLQRRHGGVPVIQSIVFLLDEDQMRLPDQDQSMMNSPQVIPISLGEEQVKSLKAEPDVQSWLPEIETLNLEHRAGVRLALLNLYFEIRKTLEQVIDNKLLSYESEETMPSDMKIASPDSTPIDIYIVGNLGDTLANGLLIDLAYLIKKITAEKEADNLSFQVNSLLLFPQLADHWQNSDDNTQAKAQAGSYAALKELDYYMDAHRYRLHYPVANETIKFDRISPFEPSCCYLIGSANEGNMTIKPYDATHMAAEWLYHIFMATLYSQLSGDFNINHYGPGQAIAGYSSISLASLMLPLRYLHDYCSRQLVCDLANFLLGEIPADQIEERINSDMNRSQMSLETLADELRKGTNENSQYRIEPTAYDHISLLQYQDLEKLLIEAYDRRQRRVLPEIKETMANNKERLERELESRLRDYTVYLLDDEPAIAIDHTNHFFLKLLKAIQQRQARVKNSLEEYERRRQRADQEIRYRRGEYFNAAQTFGKLPLLPTLLTVVAFFIIFGYTYAVLGVTLEQPVIAGVLIGLSMLAILVTTILNYFWIGSTRANFIAQYDSRLRTHRRLEEVRLEVQLLNQVKNWAESFQKDIIRFKAEIETLGTLGKERWLEQKEHKHRGTWEEILYKHPNYNLEESVIDVQDTENYYQEVCDKAYQRQQLQTLFNSELYSGPYHQWLIGGLKAEAIWEALYRYATGQAGILQQHYIVEKIEERFDRDSVRQKLDKVKRYARPFLKAQRSGLGEIGDPVLHEAIVVHFDKEEEGDVRTGSKVAQALEALQLTSNIKGLGQRERLSMITVRRGLPLYILAEVVNCHSSYRKETHLMQLHTTRGNIALPDISEDRLAMVDDPNAQFTVDPRRTFALAVALRKFDPDNFYTLYHHREQDKPALSAVEGSAQNDESEPALNPVEGPAGYYQVYVDERQLEAAQKIKDWKVKETRQHLGFSKAEACYALYIDTDKNLLLNLRRSINTYMEQADRRNLLGQLTVYLDPERMTLDEAILEDWERVELESVWEILNSQIPKLPDDSDKESVQQSGVKTR